MSKSNEEQHTMSLTTTVTTNADLTPSNVPPIRTVTCDAPGCTTSAPLPESGHLPIGWHLLERAAAPWSDNPAWHFHTPQCVANFLASLGHVAQTVEQQAASTGERIVHEITLDVSPAAKEAMAWAGNFRAHGVPEASASEPAAAPAPEPPAESAPAAEPASEPAPEAATVEAEAEPAASAEPATESEPSA